jgi:hypothetical protein
MCKCLYVSPGDCAWQHWLLRVEDCRGSGQRVCLRLRHHCPNPNVLVLTCRSKQQASCSRAARALHSWLAYTIAQLAARTGTADVFRSSAGGVIGHEGSLSCCTAGVRLPEGYASHPVLVPQQLACWPKLHATWIPQQQPHNSVDAPAGQQQPVQLPRISPS